MKRLYFLFLSLVLLFSGFSAPNIYAEATVNIYNAPSYLRVINSNTPFYKNASDVNPLFYLPYTYYVKVLGEIGSFWHVECYGTSNTIAVDGFVPKDLLFNDNLPVLNPYLSLTVTTAKTAVLYAEPDLSVYTQYIFSERNLIYLGEYPTNTEKLYFVSYNGKLGYVKESDVYPFLIANHPNELTFLTPPEEQTPSENQNSNTVGLENYFSLKIIIIVCLIFAGIVGLFIALKVKPTRSVTAHYYDENDYE